MSFPDSITVIDWRFIKVRQWVSPRGWEKAEYVNSACPITTSIVLTGDFVSLSI